MSHAQLSLLKDEQPSLDLDVSSYPVSRFAGLDPVKLRGGYYTPSEVAHWLVDWAIRSPNENVLEPSCGDGIFLKAAVERIANLQLGKKDSKATILGIEISPEEAVIARGRIASIARSRISVEVLPTDFFEWWLSPKRARVDAVVGNPPFIRYQSFPEPSRDRAMRVMRSLGLTPNRLTNSWVPFLVAATECLNEGGRLAFVVPAELLQVGYAAQLRSFLTDRFERINIVACNDLFFEGAEQEVVLLLADGALRKPSERNVCRVAMTEVERVSDLRETSPATLVSRSESKDVLHDSEKWLKYFLSNREIGLMRNLRDNVGVTQLEDHAEVDVGVVTGKNEFFLLNEEQVDTLRVRKFVKPVVGRSAHIRGARFVSVDWADLVASGQRVFLLDIGLVTRAKLPEPFREYVESAERNGFHRGYKCSIRSPWYAVPSVWEPDAFLFRQIYDFPRLVVNQAGATSTDTIHRVRCKGRPERLAAHMYTSLTAASAEIEGRSYGGGVLELEPTEAERLLVPKKLSGALALGECDRLVRRGRLADVLKENDQLILRAQIGLSRVDCRLLRGVWEKMRDRRMSRRRSKSSPNGGS